MARGDENAFPYEDNLPAGMTIREVMANTQMHALVGRVPLGELLPSDQEALADEACELADTLLAALAQEEAK